MSHMDFYTGTVRRLMQRGLISTEMSVLVVCGGTLDRDAFQALGYREVTISNLDSRMRGDEFAPFKWSYQDAENLGLPDASFDWVVAHSGLHHCHSPHRGLLEMYRVARRGVLVFEPRDSLLARVGVRFNFGQDYEVAAVVYNSMEYGGVRNTCVPNYVYRWSEREIEKALRSYAPTAAPRIHYFYALRLPHERLEAMRNRAVARTLKLFLPVIRALTTVFPRQCNNFAFAAEKDHSAANLHPWLKLRDGETVIDADWVGRHYRNVPSGKKSGPADAA
ncbi:MAG: methyltransferase domain-containing protein [Verrucomicrobiales bacterium]|nr:methyltransferase domain-containing protein [Verrucomicrobiales bacterium]